MEYERRRRREGETGAHQGGCLVQAGFKKPGRSATRQVFLLATWLLESGVPIENIADLPGHSSVIIYSSYLKFKIFPKTVQMPTSIRQ